ncbi:DNA-directed RNA polymerase subunit K [Candidatus Pacearchaeota archaeon]|nr:DNA-directed RNA polymerase subunit K [Candidatus Pacearchaeota archaeon]
MDSKLKEKFTKYEIARIMGARALQIAMDAPLLLKISEEKLKEIKYDPLKIAEIEFTEGALPITINRPLPRRIGGKISPIKEDHVSDEELVQKEQQVEKEIIQDADQLGFVEQDEDVEDVQAAETTVAGEEQ